MNNNLQKKGAVELSLNLIIMLVIGLTVVGLVIAFVTSFLGNAEDTFTSKLSEDDKTKIEQVERMSGNLAVSSSSIKVNQGEKTKLYVKLRNPTGSDITITGTDLTAQSDFGVTIADGLVDNAGTSDNIKVIGPPVQLNAGSQKGFAIEIQAGSAVSLGSYYLTFRYTSGTDIDETSIVTLSVE